MSDVIVCGDCHRRDGHSDMCNLGGYVLRGARHELVTRIEHEHNWQFDKRCPIGCGYCVVPA